MSLKSQIEAIIYAAEEPVTLAQLVTLLGTEAQAELDEQDAAKAAEAAEQAAAQPELPIEAPAEPESTPVETSSEPEAAEQAASTSEPQSETQSEPESEPLLANEKKLAQQKDRRLREHLRNTATQLIEEYVTSDRGIQISEVASGYRFGTKPEYHDVVRGFVKSLKPPLKLSLPALETLAVIAYKQPVTAAEVAEIRGVDSGGVLGSLMGRKLITTAGRKQVIGRPILYKTTKDFLLRFGLKDVSELPSIEEFEKMAGELAEQEDLPMAMEPTVPGTEPLDHPDPEPQPDGDPEGLSHELPDPEPSNPEPADPVGPDVIPDPDSPATNEIPGDEEKVAAGIENI